MSSTVFAVDEILHFETIMAVKAIKMGDDALLHACNSIVG
jgi:hypothetical protein